MGDAALLIPPFRRAASNGITQRLASFVDTKGIPAPAVSAAGEGRTYFDSGTNKYRVSENGGAYSDLISVSTFLALADTPGAFVANRIVHVNAAADALLVSSEINVLSTGELLIGRTTQLFAADLVEVSKSQNATTQLAVINETSDTAARAQLGVVAGTGGTQVIGNFIAYPVGFSPASSGALADSVEIVATGTANGIVLRTADATPIIFIPNKIQAARILSSGELAWGRATLINANDIAVFSKNTNANVQFIVTNPNVGNGATSTLTVQGDTGLRMFMSLFGSGHATLADIGSLVYTGTAELRINASADAPITFYVNNISEMVLLSGGGLIVNGTAKVGTEEFRVVGDSLLGGDLQVTGQALGPAGTSFNPTWSHFIDINTGTFRSGPDRWAVATAGILRLEVDASGNAQFTQDVEIDGDLNHDGSLIGFNGAAPVAQSTGWAVSNVTPDKVFDADTVAIDELADVVGTLIDYMKTRGDLAA